MMKPERAAYFTRSARHPAPARSRGFTLLELLSVIAIIGLLAAILIPTVGSARNAARKAKNKVLFSQWSVAMEQFKQEYGYYPKIDSGSGNRLNFDRFVAALTGRKIDGTAATAADLCGNTKRIAFYALSDSELNEARTAVVDAFGNEDIAVLYDKTGDGRITSLDGSVVSVAGAGGSFSPSIEELDLTSGINAGVIFYSAGRGNNVADLVFSWK